MKTGKMITVFYLYWAMLGVCSAQPIRLPLPAIDDLTTNLMVMNTVDSITGKEVRATKPNLFMPLEYNWKDSASKLSSLQLHNDDLGLFLCYRFNVSLFNGFYSIRKKNKPHAFPNLSFRLMAGII